jgi:hypothetical protein
MRKESLRHVANGPQSFRSTKSKRDTELRGMIDLRLSHVSDLDSDAFRFLLVYEALDPPRGR